MNNTDNLSLSNITITVTPQKMYDSASQLENKANCTKNLLSELNNIIDNTKQYWEGKVSEKERNKFGNVETNAQAIIKNINNFAFELKSITELYENAEKDITENCNSLPSGIIN